MASEEGKAGRPRGNAEERNEGACARAGGQPRHSSPSFYSERNGRLNDLPVTIRAEKTPCSVLRGIRGLQLGR